MQKFQCDLETNKRTLKDFMKGFICKENATLEQQLGQRSVVTWLCYYSCAVAGSLGRTFGSKHGEVRKHCILDVLPSSQRHLPFFPSRDVVLFAWNCSQESTRFSQEKKALEDQADHCKKQRWSESFDFKCRDPRVFIGDFLAFQCVWPLPKSL